MDEAFQAADNVLRNAVGGIAEIINFPGLVNVDFEDVRTVDGRDGHGDDGLGRRRRRRPRRVSPPSRPWLRRCSKASISSGARGVLVNITAAKGSLKMKEVQRGDEHGAAPSLPRTRTSSTARSTTNRWAMRMRVTVVATGLGQAAAAPALRGHQHPGRPGHRDRRCFIAGPGVHGASTTATSTCRRWCAMAVPTQLTGRGVGQQRRRSLRHPGFPAQTG